MNKQYIVSEKDIKKREDFYDYIINNYNFKISYPYEKDKFIKSIFPFIIDFKENTMWICESITSLACASQSKKIITIDEFKRVMI